MQINRSLKLIWVLSLICFYGCGEENLPEDYLASVNDRILTKRTISFLIDSSRINDVYLEMLINNWIETELLAQAALSEGLEGKDEFAVRNDYNTRQLLAAEFLKEKFKTINRSVSTEELQNYFQSHQNEFILDYDIYKVNQIIVRNFSKAIDLRNSILSQLDFSKSVRLIFKPEEILEEKNGVYLREFDPIPYELQSMLETMEPGEISYPIDLGNGEYLMTQLIAKYVKGENPQLEFVKDLIEERIIFEREKKFYNELIQKLSEEADIKIKR